MGVGLEPEPAVLAAADAAAAALSDAGAEVVEVRSFLTEGMLDGICRFFEARSCNDVAALPAEARTRILPFVVEWCTWRAGGFSGPEVLAASLQVQAMRQPAVAAVAGLSFVLPPVAPTAP